MASTVTQIQGEIASIPAGPWTLVAGTPKPNKQRWIFDVSHDPADGNLLVTLSGFPTDSLDVEPFCNIAPSSTWGANDYFFRFNTLGYNPAEGEFEIQAGGAGNQGYRVFINYPFSTTL